MAKRAAELVEIRNDGTERRTVINMVQQNASRKPVLVIGVAGSSAAYKICNLIRMLRKSVEMHVVVTEAATEFIQPKQFHVLTGNPVLVNLFEGTEYGLHPHVTLSKELDAILFAPATSDIIGKIVAGVATDALSTLALSILPADKPCFVAPTMMPSMLAHPAVLRNLETLRRWGYRIIEPDDGQLADGLRGPGRLAEPERIASEIRRCFGFDR